MAASYIRTHEKETQVYGTSGQSLITQQPQSGEERKWTRIKTKKRWHEEMGKMKRKAEGKSDQEARRGRKTQNQRTLRGPLVFFVQRSFKKKKNRLSISACCFCIASAWHWCWKHPNRWWSIKSKAFWEVKWGCGELGKNVKVNAFVQKIMNAKTWI